MSEIENTGVDMYFATNYCDAYLITASTSTYAWWIAFLMPKEVPVFYYDCHLLECKHITKKDYFLPKWQGINYNYFVQGNKLREKEENEVNETLFYYQKWLEPLDSFRKIPEYEKFVLSEKMNGRLGNQMFRFATLYAIGQMTNRTPVYGYNDCQMINYDEELSVLFPNFHSRIYFLKEDFNDTYNYPFATDCCDLIDTNVGDNSSYKICVHTRVGDFIGKGESKIGEVSTAIERIIKNHKV
uniref:L-Fucosyltransferase n=1 Tax=Meloidogyne hapla TaxID=6305 RepID=A0A1I8BXG8_MELHA